MGINEILKEYEKIRDLKEKERDNRVLKIYDLYPEYMEIDKKINELNIKLLKEILDSNYEYIKDNAVTDKEKAQKANVEKLLKERENLEKKQKEFLESKNISIKNIQIQYNCELCKDTGFINEKEGGKKVLCECIKKQIVEEQSISSNLNRYSNSTFDNFDLSYYQTEQEQEKAKIALEKSKEFVNDFFNKDAKVKNIIFIGETGLGKTHLSEAIGLELINKEVEVIYDTTANILNKLMEYKQESLKKYNEYSKKIKNIPLLILDDFGAENLTDAKKEEILNIINERIFKNFKTIISTNYRLNELNKKYSDRVISRIIGEYTILQLIGKDIRLQKKSK